MQLKQLQKLSPKKIQVERCTGIAEVMGLNPVQACIFFRLSFRNCLSCVYNCDDPSLIQYLAS